MLFLCSILGKAHLIAEQKISWRELTQAILWWSVLNKSRFRLSVLNCNRLLQWLVNGLANLELIVILQLNWPDHALDTTI